MMLINSLLAHATETLWEAFIAKLEKLNIRKAVTVRFPTSDHPSSFYPHPLRLSLHIMTDSYSVHSSLSLAELDLALAASSPGSQSLMSSHMVEDLTSCVLDFQGNLARVTYRKKTTLVDPDHEEAHALALQYIWERSKLKTESDGEGGLIRWRKLGFDSENLSREFGEVGVLGLDCMVCSISLLSSRSDGEAGEPNVA